MQLLKNFRRSDHQNPSIALKTLSLLYLLCGPRVIDTITEIVTNYVCLANNSYVKSCHAVIFLLNILRST